MDSYVLLTAADRQIESLLRGADPAIAFDDNLIQSILFHDGAVLPDIFAFISSVLSERQSEAGVSRLELAIEKGLVIPAFRSDCRTFADSLELIARQGIQGLQENPLVVAHRLDQSLAARKQSSILSWPRDISSQYASLVLTTLSRLMSDAPSSMTPALQQQYLSMKKLVTETGLQDVCKSRILGSQGELRRGTFLNILLDVLNKRCASGISKVDDSKRDLLDHPACKQDLSLKSAIEGFVSTANALYHINMADAFRVGAYLADDLYADSALVGVTAAVRAARGIDSDPVSSGTPTTVAEFSMKIQIPSVSQLREVPWADLVAIRDDLGRGYFAALKAWRNDPSAYASELERCLSDYAKKLTLRVKSKAPLVTVALRKFADSDKENIKAAAEFALSALSEDNPAVKMLVSAVGPLSNIAYSWLSERSVEVHQKAKAGVAKAIIV